MSAGFSPLRATRFYIPLILQAISQSLTYPLVATVVTRGRGGAADFGAFAQGHALFFLISSLGSGLITTGMVYNRSQAGMRHFARLCRHMNIVIALLVAACALPPLDGILFDRILSLNPEMRRVTRDTLLLSIPCGFLFMWRHLPLTLLFNGRASGAANLATVGRIAGTLLLSALFVRVGWVGHYAGIVAFTFPIAGELLATRHFARPFARDLPEDSPGSGSLREQLLFCMPLSFGGFLLALSGFMVGAFITRAGDPERMLAVHYVAMGVVNPISFAAIRMQAVVLAFPPQDTKGTNSFRFAFIAGMLLSAVVLLGQVPGIASVYFGQIQNLPQADVVLAQRVMLVAILIPWLQALRGHAEGLAAWRKLPNAILAGQAVYLAFLVTTLFFLLHMGVPGYLMGVIAIAIAVGVSFVTMRLGLYWSELERFQSPPVPPTSSA